MVSEKRGNFFQLDNDIFRVGLCPGEFAVYAYLRRCCNIRTAQCWPSYATIGRAVGLSKNTVKKYVDALAEKGLIQTEPTERYTKEGMKLNGSLKYTLPPLSEVLRNFYQRQLDGLDDLAERKRVEAELEREKEA